MFLFALTLTLLTPFGPQDSSKKSSDSGGFVVSAEHVHTQAGAVLSPGQVLIKGGKIAEVGATVAAGKLPVFEVKGHLSAGMIALGETTLLGDQAADTTRFQMPEAEARFGFNAQHPGLQRLAKAGITTVVLTPPSHSLLAGRGLIAKTGTGRMLAKSGSMHVAFDRGMFEDREDPAEAVDFGGGFFFFFGPNGAVNPNGYKSSYSGASELLEDAVKDKQSQASKIVGGSMRAWLRSGDRAEALRALDFAKRHKVKGTLEGGARIGDLADQIKASGLGVSMTLFRETNSHFGTKSALALSKAGVPFGFSLQESQRNAVSLRMAAALCRRAGLGAKECWQALTSGAAQAAGLQGQVGSIKKGLDADLVLWDGNPNELTSGVLRVWVDGQAVQGIEPRVATEQGTSK